MSVGSWLLSVMVRYGDSLLVIVYHSCSCSINIGVTWDDLIACMIAFEQASIRFNPSIYTAYFHNILSSFEFLVPRCLRSSYSLSCLPLLVL